MKSSPKNYFSASSIKKDRPFQLLLESLKDLAFYTLDKKGYITSWNVGAQNIKGYKEKEIIGKHFSLFYPKEDAQNGKPQRALKIAVERGAYTEQGFRVRKDGERFIADVLITAIKDKKGQLVGFSKITRDITAKKEIELRLQESEHFIKQMANIVPGMIAVYNVRTFKYIYVNSTVRELLGYEPEEFLDKGVAFVGTLVHPDDAKKINLQNQKALEQANNRSSSPEDAEIIPFEYRMRHKSGKWVWLNTYGTIFSRGSDGKVEQLLNISVDITHRKHVEKQLEESKKRLSEAQAIAHIGSWEWDVQKNSVVWSDELCAIYGISECSDLSFEGFLRAVHPDDRAPVQEIIEKSLKKKSGFEFYHRIVRPDGVIRTLHAHGEVILDAEKSVVKMIGTGQDVTDQKIAEESLKKRTQELQLSRDQLKTDRAKDEALLRSMGEGIVATDKNSLITLLNPQAELILGIQAKKALGKDIFKVQPFYTEQGKLIESSQLPVYQALHKGHSIKATKSSDIFYKKGELLIPLALTANPIYYKKKIIGAIQVFRDITKEKEIDRVKSELISLASHQLRTPLTAINWYSEALLSEELGKLTASQKNYLKQIFNANQKMVELVYDFLNVSRIELGKFSIQISTLNILEVSKSVLQELEPVISAKKLLVTQKYQRGLENILGDKKVVRLILQNLLSNAVKYTPKKGKVSLAIKLQEYRAKKTLIVEVSDTGYGIPKKQQPKIFTKLFRADNIASLDTEGTGLGLYIVKSFVDLSGGKIWFKSIENKGTIFHIEMPLEK